MDEEGCGGRINNVLLVINCRKGFVLFGFVLVRLYDNGLLGIICNERSRKISRGNMVR